MKIKNQEILISNEKKFQRIDNFLFVKFKGFSKNSIYRFIRKGIIRINKKRIQPKYKLQCRDIISVPKCLQGKIEKNNIFSFKKIKFLLKYILYEDNYLIVFNKPSGIAVHGGTGLNFGIIEALRFLKPNIKSLELVHRLDRETSGILLISKKNFILRTLHEQFFQKKIKKEYIALVKGRWPNFIKKISVPLLKKIDKNKKKIIYVSPLGKKSETKFKIQEKYKNATLMKIFPITGRMHQIRVHTFYYNHPIAYDKIYGDFEFNKKLLKIGLNRLFLHAKKIQFLHPITNKIIIIKSPLENSLKYCLQTLRTKNIDCI